MIDRRTVQVSRMSYRAVATVQSARLARSTKIRMSIETWHSSIPLSGSDCRKVGKPTSTKVIVV
jgi:hypothetical protein